MAHGNDSNINFGTSPGGNDDSRYAHLIKKLGEHYTKYQFEFLVEYKIYGQAVQLFQFSRVSEGGRRKSCMLTFNANPGDVLWNIRQTDKHSIAELMRVHKRVGRPGSFSQSLFHGKEFFANEDAVAQGPRAHGPRYRNYPRRSPAEQNEVQNYKQHNETHPTIQSSPVSQASPLPRRTIPSPLKPQKSETPLSLDKLKDLFKSKGWIKH